jgi:hypothetical protein
VPCKTGVESSLKSVPLRFSLSDDLEADPDPGI